MKKVKAIKYLYTLFIDKFFARLVIIQEETLLYQARKYDLLHVQIRLQMCECLTMTIVELESQPFMLV